MPNIVEQEREFSPDQRRRMARSGVARPDGSFPIPDRDALRRAIQSIGRANPSDRAAVRRHIIKRARALGAVSMLPDDWNVSEAISAEEREQIRQGIRDGSVQPTRLPESTRSTPTTGERMHLRETTATSLSEAAVNQNGQVLLRLIAPGWSQNGRYYSESLLKRDGLQRFREGTQSYLDHPSRSESLERPERSVRDLVGSLTENAYYDPNGPVGPGLYARASVREEYRPLVDELAEVIGMSIRADGTGHHGEAEGRQGTIIDTIESVDSVDYVTSPAAGGRVIQLIESVQNPDRRVDVPDDPAQLREARNAADWIEVEIHRGVLGLVNSMWEQGNLTREEWQAVNAATVAAMDGFRSSLTSALPDLLTRDPMSSPEPAPTDVTESATTGETPPPEAGETTETPPAETEAETNADPSAPIEESTSTKEDAMTDTPGAGTAPTPLAEFRQQIHSELDQARQRAAMAEARERARAIISAQLAEATISPAAAHDVTVSVMADLPLTEQRELNEAALITRIQERVDQKILEATEVLSAAGLGTPRDVGYTDEPSTYVPSADHFINRRIDRYRKLGMSESAAKIAANGRA